MTRMGLPWTPPRAFTSSIARAMPSRVSVPNVESGPESERYAPMGMSSALGLQAHSDAAARSRTRSAATLPESLAWRPRTIGFLRITLPRPRLAKLPA